MAKIGRDSGWRQGIYLILSPKKSNLNQPDDRSDTANPENNQQSFWTSNLRRCLFSDFME